ncbi:methyltransferase domain-containing protein [candidate division WWE3 bacterium]|uniref:Methyltransferase domain-containing protein n=1 Tax=candidate division WWE3 bacterium TaxID=2053526 RepID=A0A7X9HSE5_UNCKA|nr:methyltransferase domain-containing protein [candidate division WWE3 bacterium]
MLTAFLYLISIVLCFIPIVFILDVMLSGKSPLVTTPTHARQYLKDNLNLNENSIFYDLGCGTSSLLIKLSSSFPRSKIVGVDNSPFSYLISKIRILLNRSRNISIEYKDFFNVNLSQATHIYLWIYVKDMDKLLDKFKSELNTGTLVYSLDFPFSYKEPVERINLGETHKFGHTLYIYKF